MKKLMKYSSVANPGRRNFFKTGVAATGALLVASGETQAQVFIAPILPPSLALPFTHKYS